MILFFRDKRDNLFDGHTHGIALLGAVMLQNRACGLLHGGEARACQLVGVNDDIDAPLLKFIFGDRVEGGWDYHYGSSLVLSAETPDKLEDLCRILAARMDHDGICAGTDEGSVLKIYKTVPLLIIDDIGKEPPTEWAISTIYNIINGRYEAYQPTIITTNYDTDALIQRMTPRDTRDDTTAKATLDRLMEMCRGVTMAGDSWRRK